MTDIFDITAPLPHGTVLLEASAGTGKTWSIAAVCARAIVADGLDVSALLVVTFNRSATRELRGRIHGRLAHTVAVLEGRGAPKDQLDEFLLDADEAVLAERLERAGRALDHMGAATIATTHEFAARMLDELGILADSDPTSTLLPDLGPLVDEVSADLFLTDHVDDPQAPRPESWQRLGRQVAVRHGEVDLPEPPADGPGRARNTWAQRVRAESTRRSRLLGVHTFDDLISDLASALADPQRGQVACAILADRFRLVLVDEFQDTDPLQWEVLRRAFHHRSDLWLIGDPKQSIYAFRGADIHSYLAAASAADHRLELATNWRSDGPVVDAVSTVFGRAWLGDPLIHVSRVEARHATCRLESVPSGDHRYDWSQPVQLRAIAPEGPAAMTGPRADELITADLVNQVIMMLEGGSTWQPDGQPRRPLEPGDIAVLVRTRRRGAQIQAALAAAGQPAVFAGDTSVWSSRAAGDLADLLEALDDPQPTTITRLCLSHLIGANPADLAREDSRMRSDLAVDLAAWAPRWDELGPWGVVQALVHRPGLLARILGSPEGERYVTDLRHVAQGTHAAIRDNALTAADAAAWIRGRSALSDDESPRRLETDRRAVSIMTIHRAKGLGFPVVLLPDVASSWVRRDKPEEPIVWFDGSRRVLHLGGSGADRDRAWRSHRDDELAEDLRTLYVAMTRARSALRLWWAPAPSRFRGSALQRLLEFDDARGADPGVGEALHHGPHECARLAGSPVHVVDVPRQIALERHDDVADRHLGQAASMTRPIDGTWVRTSYSALTADLHAAALVEARSGLDEPEADAAPEPLATGAATDTTDATSAQPSEEETTLLCTMPGGTSFGTLVHAVLERVDTDTDDLHAEVLARTRRLLRSGPMDGVAPEQLADGLVDVLHADLGDLLPGQCLADVPVRDRRAELDFELALAPRSSGAATVGDIAAALRDPALVPPEDPLAGYGAVLAESPAAPRVLAGFLTGSIDAVLRTPQGRFVVVDYKTNRAPTPPGRLLRPADYDAATMTAMMIDSHYPLQALLYSAALHRFLAATLADYDPARHLGPVGYLFVRGMSGHRTGVAAGTTPPGVFVWHPRTDLVVRVSDLLGGRRAR
ncbi:UvrD-helicase domain-containing protein [Acidipropionibacterium timonense]|uniref:UvrD-helicase domain-containing protein n=1 Tax=Acidipropionibacterium timonense TaxID=2161818 RepID=UPI0010313E72|nr:UvrD-helicase domain-containing protein [Acidipropionibacterium timonense]